MELVVLLVRIYMELSRCEGERVEPQLMLCQWARAEIMIRCLFVHINTLSQKNVLFPFTSNYLSRIIGKIMS